MSESNQLPVSQPLLCMAQDSRLSAREFIRGWDQAHDHPHCLIADMFLGTFWARARL